MTIGRRLIGWSAGVGCLVFGGASGVAGTPTVDRGLIHNEDFSHFYKTCDPDRLDMAELHAFIDQYAGTQLTHFFMNGNAMRTSFRSAVWGNIWGSEDPEPGIASGRSRKPR